MTNPDADINDYVYMLALGKDGSVTIATNPNAEEELGPGMMIEIFRSCLQRLEEEHGGVKSTIPGELDTKDVLASDIYSGLRDAPVAISARDHDHALRKRAQIVAEHVRARRAARN